jgi:hypothetical protein
VNASRDFYKHLGWLRALQDRSEPRFDVYGRFGAQFATETRRKAVGLLEKQTSFRYEGGLKTVRYSRFLKEAALSEVCIDLPGNGDFCFRLIDYLAVGACVIALRHRTTLPAPLLDREHIVYTKDDLSDLVDLCRYYLDHPQERKRIRAAGRSYFDRYLHREQLARYYLHEALRAASCSPLLRLGWGEGRG